MATTSVKALINPDVLIWARESAHYELDDAAKKIGTKPHRLEAWEKGKDRPTINQLFKIANTYKRPSATFYLPKPPKQPTLTYPRDYRRLSGMTNEKESPNLIFALRNAEYKRKIAIELHRELELLTPELPYLVNMVDDTEEAAQRLRQFLAVSDDTQLNKWRRRNESFNGWRTLLENKGVLIFQISAQQVALSEMRAISITARPLPYVLLNSSDSINARIFSLLHELVHMTLSDGDATDQRKPAEEQQVEIFCNAVASAILMPEHLVRFVIDTIGEVELEDSFIAQAADTLGASKEAFVRRLVTLGYATEDFYRAKREQYGLEYLKLRKNRKERDKEEGKKTIIPMPTKIINATGTLLSTLILDNLNSGNINISDASEYFGASARHIPKIEQAIYKYRAHT